MTKGNGTYRKYAEFSFGEDRLVMIRRLADLSDQYEKKGYPLTVRQAYYQFVSRNWIENSKGAYNQIGNAISDGRMAGLISWTAFEDRGRNLMGHETFDSPAHAMKGVLDSYKIDMWADQPFRAEVWVEKEALVGVIGSICNKLRVDFFACKGYNSQSEQWRAGRRFASYVSKGQTPIVFHLGDHDPSGIDMTRDNRDRLSLFAGTPINVQRIALNMSQIEELQPPPNYAKASDSRYDGYRKLYGEECWELDALDPERIHQLIEDAVLKVRDQSKWDEMEEQETADKRVLEMQLEELGGPGV